MTKSSKGNIGRRIGPTTSLFVASLMVVSCTSSAPAQRSTIAPTAVAAKTLPCQFTEQRGGDLQTIVAAAERFRDGLQPIQRIRLVRSLVKENGTLWSNFPAALVPRAGVALGELNPDQLRAANQLIEEAVGRCGFQAFDGNRQSDAVSHKGIPYIDPALHYISFNGQPSPTEPWMLMLGGHHMAFNLVFNGKDAGATPMLIGTDPAKFFDETGAVRFPLEWQSMKLADMTGALTAYPEAKLSGVYTDLVKSVTLMSEAGNPLGPNPAPGPGQPAGPAAGPPSARAPVSSVASWFTAERFHTRLQDGRIAGTDTMYPRPYPTGTTGRGVNYAALSPADQVRVRDAIRSFISLSSSQTSASLLKLYEDPAALAQTYVSYSGDPSLTKPAGYVRIDGPRVWIEVSVQASLVDRNTMHFHALWRDKVSDYGGVFKT